MKLSCAQILWIEFTATIHAIYLVLRYGFDEALTINYKKIRELKKRLEKLEQRG